MTPQSIQQSFDLALHHHRAGRLREAERLYRQILSVIPNHVGSLHFLGAFPFGGGITTLDALWMGVPLITLSGKTAVGRGGRSILSNLDLAEFIAFDIEQYKGLAIELAQDIDPVERLRRELRDRMMASPILDGRGFAGCRIGVSKDVANVVHELFIANMFQLLHQLQHISAACGLAGRRRYSCIVTRWPAKPQAAGKHSSSVEW